METYDVSLKQFKFDFYDQDRRYDILRSIILFKEIVRVNYDKKKSERAVRLARNDLPYYRKLYTKYPKISIETVDQLAIDFRIKFIIWTKSSSRALAIKMYETSADYDMGSKYIK